MQLLKLNQNPFLQTVLIIALGYAAWVLRLPILIIFVAFLLTTVFYPVVAFLKKHHWPTPLAVILPIIAVFALFGLLLYLVLPPFISRVVDFINTLPDFINNAAKQLHVSINTTNLQDVVRGRVGNLSHVVISTTKQVVTIFAAVLSIIVMSVYWLGSYDKVRQAVLDLFHGQRRHRLEDIWRRIEIKLRFWLQAHIILNTVVGLCVWISMSLIGIPFADLLALLAFTVEIIPTAGPFIAATPAIALGLSESLAKGVAVALTYLVIQQIESHVLSPLLLGRTVKLHPLVILISLLVGAESFGIIGALIAVPVTLCLSSVVDSYRGDPVVRDGGVAVIKTWLRHVVRIKINRGGQP